MNTKNVIWGLVLVLIGVLFILKNLDIIYFSWYGIWKLWPLVLVLIGIAILPIKSGIKIALAIITLDHCRCNPHFLPGFRQFK